MRKKPPEIIDVTDYRVIDDGGREPIIKSWGALVMFIAPIAVIFAVRYAQIKGWL